MIGKTMAWFHNRSLRWKLTALFLLLLTFIQFASGILLTNIVETKLREDLQASNQLALEQMTANVDEILMNIVENLYPVLATTQSVQLQNKSVAEFLQPDVQDNLREHLNSSYVINNIEYQRLFNQMMSSRNNYRYIHSMLVVRQDGTVHSYFSNSYYALSREPLFDQLQRDYGNESEHYIWTGVLNGSYYFPQCQERLISLIAPVRLYRQARSFVVLNINVSRLQAYMDSMSSENSTFLLQSLQGDLLCGALPEKISAKEEWLLDALEATRHQNAARNGEFVLLTTKLTVNDWPVSILYNDAANDGVAFLFRTIIPLLIGIGVVMMASSSYIVNKVTKPLSKLTAIIRINTTDRKRALRFNARYHDEVGVLGDAYNNMMDALEQEQKQRREAYMKMLQMQIKPHFLYNSMESTRFLVEMGDARAVDMIRAIVTYYKLSLSGLDEQVSIRKEIEQIECYLQILQLRYTSRYDYTIDIDPNIMDDEIEKFTLQPLVENAVYHGIKCKRGKGHIHIQGTREAGLNVIVVSDNGIGIPPSKLQELQRQMENTDGVTQSDHIGLVNVHQRLRLRYGNEYGLHLESEGEQTRVRIVIPAIRWCYAEEVTDDQSDDRG